MDNVRVDLTAASKRTLKNLEGTDLMPSLRKAMRKATRGSDLTVKRAARALPSKSHDTGTDSLRAEVARSVKRRVRVNSREVMVGILIVPHGGKSNLARAMEGTIHWQHMVYGRKGTEDLQEPQPFFFQAIAEITPGVESEVIRVLDEFAKDI